MGFAMQCIGLVLMLCGQLVLTSPLIAGHKYKTSDGRMCQMCPAGEYQKACTECEPCPAGQYTTEWNREDSCHPCYGDCRADFHLKVAQSCTSRSDVTCICEAGFRCTEQVSYSTNCKYCERIQETVSTEAAAIISVEDKHRPSSASSGHSTSAKPCQFPKCGPLTVPPAGNDTHFKTGKTSSQLAVIFCPVVVLGCIALVILFSIHRPRDESCFKQAFSKLCNEGGGDASHKPKESTHQFPRDSFSAKQQPSSLLAANLGPVHVHNPGTVIFSLLSQFTGHVGPTVEGGKTTARVMSEEKDERDCPVFHPTSSPSIHLSEEERSGDIDSMFFPSQEQGKDCHMSKEEAR